MAVEDVSIPAPRKVTDVKGGKEKDTTDADYWERKAKDAEAKVKFETSQRELDRIAGGGSPKEPAFQVTGRVDMGNINYQQMIEKAQTEGERLRKEAEDNAQAQANANETLRAQLHQQELKLLSEINEKNIQITRLALQSQIEKMSELVASSTSRKSFMEQYTEAMQVATALGLAKPGPESTDLRATIELKKLEFDNNRENRRLAKEDKAEERRWQLELRRLDDERDARKQEQEANDKKWGMIASAPETVGRVLAQGLLDRAEQGSTGQVSANPPPPSAGKKIEAGVGESGEVSCPKCSETVAIGATATQAVCARCGTKLPIIRVEKPAPQPAKQTAPQYEENEV